MKTSISDLSASGVLRGTAISPVAYRTTMGKLLLVACCVFWFFPVLATGTYYPDSPLVAAEVSTLLNFQDWPKYENPAYGFSIRYPKYLTPGMGKELWGSITGQIVAFVPLTLAPYSSTNLVDYSVLIGPVGTNPLCGTKIHTKGKNEINGSHDSRFYSSEGAAGHLYEEIGYPISINGISCEIVILIHSTNLGAMPPGVLHFDADGLVRLFETMVHTLVVMK
jgi:hypothetical protein